MATNVQTSPMTARSAFSWEPQRTLRLPGPEHDAGRKPLRNLWRPASRQYLSLVQYGSSRRLLLVGRVAVLLQDALYENAEFSADVLP